MRWHGKAHVAGTIASLVLVFGSGCGTQPAPTVQVKTSIENLTALYVDYASEHGHGPKNAAEFRRYLTEEGSPEVAKLDIQDVNAIFLSERDGKPLTVVYGIVPARPIAPTMPSFMTYEKTIEPGSRSATHQGCVVAYETKGANG